jgi:circadian clock protein KaiC
MMTDNSLISTGIYGLDHILRGGVLKGNVILVEGITGTGKTVFGIEFVYRGITEFGEPGLIVVFETTPAKIVRDANGFGWDLDRLQKENQLRIIFTTPQVLLHELTSPASLLLETAAQIGAKRIFIDGVNLLDGVRAEDRSDGNCEFRVGLQRLLEGLTRGELTAVISHEVATGQSLATTSPIAEFLADTIIHLSRDNRDAGVQRTIEIVKSRGQDYDSGRHSLEIADKKGLRVFRRVQLPLRISSPQPSSFDFDSAIGIQALDDLLGGGIYRGAATAMCGVSGVGKTILGMQLLLEGAMKLGQRGLLVSLDEQPAQISRNAKTLGLQWEEAVDQGLIHVFHDSPQELEINAHFDRIRETIESNNIQRLVIDGMTSYSTALKDHRVYRDFFHTLVSFTKQRLMLAFFSYENPEVFGITHFMPDFPVNSIVDNIFVLNFVELGNTLRRSLTVAKTRGRNNMFVTREFNIGQGGISMPADRGEPLPQLPFSRYYGLLSRAPTRVSPDIHGLNVISE